MMTQTTVAERPVAMVSDVEIARQLAYALAPLDLDTRQCCRAIAEWVTRTSPELAAIRSDLTDVVVAMRLLKIAEAAIEHIEALRFQTCGSA